MSYGEPKGVCGRLGMGMYLLGRVYEGYLSGKAARELPVDGIKEELVAHGQAGQFYRHLYFLIGCRFLGWLGMLASWFMHQVDVRQVAAGRIGINGRDQGQCGGVRVCGDFWTGRGGEYRVGRRRRGFGRSWRHGAHRNPIV